MKRLYSIKGPLLLLIVSVLVLPQSLKAQEWLHRKNALYSVGLGGTSGIGFYNDGLGNYYRSNTGAGLSLNVSGEYTVHKIIGLGWETGTNFYFARTPYAHRYYYYPWHYYDAAEIPLIMKVNVHILEATKAKDKLKDKLDVYAGANVGVGLGIFMGAHSYEFPDRHRLFANLHIGPQVGVRYWIGPKAAIFAEFGWGATFANIGATF